MFGTIERTCLLGYWASYGKTANITVSCFSVSDMPVPFHASSPIADFYVVQKVDWDQKVKMECEIDFMSERCKTLSQELELSERRLTRSALVGVDCEISYLNSPLLRLLKFLSVLRLSVSQGPI